MNRAIALGFLVALSSIAPARSDDFGLPLPMVPRGFGVNIHFTDPTAGEMDRFAQARFGLARMDLAWAAVERTKGRFDFAAYDRLIAHLARAGTHPLLILDYGNPLYDHGRAPHTDAAREAFARFAAAAALHFRGRGVLWEIWNEPNLEQFWKPAPDPSLYSRLAISTARALRKADPDAVILAPGSSGFPWEFFDTVFGMGLLEYVDAVSVHPYREQAPETAGADFGRLRALIARHATPNRRALPIVCSEWGYATAAGAVSESTQAHYLTRLWLANLAAGVNVSIFYDWRDDGDDPKEREHRFGTVRRDLAPKPSFQAAQALIAALDGFTFRHRLKGSGPDDWRLLFQRADSDALALVTWNAAPTAPAADRAPRVQSVARDDAEFAPLRRLASVHLPAGPLAEGAGETAAFDATIVRLERGSGRVAMSVEGAAVAVPEPGQQPQFRVTLPTPRLRAERRTVVIELRWDGKPLPATAPLEVWRVDPLALNVAPRGSMLEATIENPARTSFSGSVSVVSAGRTASSKAVAISTGAARQVVRLPRLSSSHEIVLSEADGSPVARVGPRRYEPMAGVTDGAGSASGYNFVLYVENRPSPPAPLPIVATEPDSPGSRALALRYEFDRGWRYAIAAPVRPAPIPARARALLAWVHCSATGDYLRSRFRDATGQTFQRDLGRLDGSGWHPVSIALDGSGPGSHWGGAGDGVPHPPLSWEALVLVDSARRDNPHRGELLLAAPSYTFDE